ncbi:MAG: hypothetical protein ACK42G_02575 [Candidatus Kapaibacteriota bacterium]
MIELAIQHNNGVVDLILQSFAKMTKKNSDFMSNQQFFSAIDLFLLTLASVVEIVKDKVLSLFSTSLII